MDTPPTLLAVASSWVDCGCGKVSDTLKGIKEATSLPWPVIIGASAVAVRVVLLPLRLRVALNGRLFNCTTLHCNQSVAPGLKAHFHRLKDPQAGALYKQAITQQWTLIAKHVGASPWKSLSVPVVAVPCFLGVGGGLRRLAQQDADVLGVLLAGFQPLSALPAFVLNLSQIELMRRERVTKGEGEGEGEGARKSLRKNLPYVLSHAANIFGLILLTQVPVAVNVFIASSSALSLVELLVGKAFTLSFIDQLAQSSFQHRIKSYPKPSPLSSTPAIKL